MNRSILLIVIFASFITYCSCGQPSEETVVHHNIHAAVDSTWKEYKLTMQAGMPGVRLYLPPVYDTSRFDIVGTSDGISDCNLMYDYQFKQKANKWHHYQFLPATGEAFDSLHIFRIYYSLNPSCDTNMRGHFPVLVWSYLKQEWNERKFRVPAAAFDTIVYIDNYPFYISGNFASVDHANETFKHRENCMQYYAINATGNINGKLVYLSFDARYNCKKDLSQYRDECFNVMGTMSFIK